MTGIGVNLSIEWVSLRRFLYLIHDMLNIEICSPLKPAPLLGTDRATSCQGLIEGAENSLLVCRKAAFEGKIVRGVVRAKDRPLQMQSGDDIPRLLQQLIGPWELKLAPFGLTLQGSAWYQHEAQEGEVPGLHLIEGLDGCGHVLVPHVPAA